jgi:hypothetical protein
MVLTAFSALGGLAKMPSPSTGTTMRGLPDVLRSEKVPIMPAIPK